MKGQCCSFIFLLHYDWRGGVQDRFLYHIVFEEKKLYKKTAKTITNFFINHSIVKESDRNVYEYGYEVFLSQFVYILIMIIISLIFKALIESMVFFLGFYLYRKFSGGYHADTYFKCHILFAINQTVFLCLLNFYPLLCRYLFVIFASIVTSVITFLLSPVDHPNKLFDESEFKKYKKQSRLFCVLFILITLIFMIVAGNNKYYFCFSVGVLSASISLLYAYIERRAKNGKDQENSV